MLGLMADLFAKPDPARLAVACLAGDRPHHLGVGPHRVHGFEVGHCERADDQPVVSMGVSKISPVRLKHPLG